MEMHVGVSNWVAYKINREVQVEGNTEYAPISATDDEDEVEGFYEEISNARGEHRTGMTMVIGDFNTKDFTYGVRNR